MRSFTIVLALSLAAAAAEARIYKWVMPDGSVTYSDRPQEPGAEAVELPPLVTYTPSPVSGQGGEAESGQAQAQAPVEDYDSFSLASPANDATIRDNAGNVTLNFAVTPTLVEGHAIDIFMDGRKFGQSRLPIVTLSNVNRGTHQIYGAIVDESGNELARSETITVHLQRAAVAGGSPVGGGASPGGPQSPGGAGSPTGSP